MQQPNMQKLCSYELSVTGENELGKFPMVSELALVCAIP